MKPAIPDDLMNLSAHFTEFEEEEILYDSPKSGIIIKCSDNSGEMGDLEKLQSFS